MAQTINEAGLALIKHFEGLRLDAYQDVAGIWTIGYGHIRGVTKGMQITEAQATGALEDDLAGAEATINATTNPAGTTSNQFSAMVSLCFNIGSANFRASTVLHEHVAGNFPAAANAFLLWNKATINGVLTPVEGLTARRTAERALYLT